MTEEKLSRTIKKIAENYEHLEQSLVAQLQLGTPNQPYTIGAYRERVWKSLFEMIIPKKYCIEQSVFIIDSYGKISKEVDLAVFDEMYTPYIFNYGEIKFIPIEAVAVVIQCKSQINTCKIEEAKSTEDGASEPEQGKTEKKSKETIYQNLMNWVDSIRPLKTSLDSVSRIMTDLVDNYDRNHQNNQGGQTGNIKKLTQTSTRPVTVLCATGIAEPMREELKKHFDLLLYVENDEKKNSSSQQGQGPHLAKEFGSETQDFIEWNKQLNHYDPERYEGEDREYVKSKRQDNFYSEKSLEERNLTQLRVLKKGGDENRILSLTFQFNQLLMLINNPMLFPHRAYAEMFTHILKNELPGEGGSK